MSPASIIKRTCGSIGGGGGAHFDELEPRITPRPIVLECPRKPSVPEVSLIFGADLGSSPSRATSREEKFATYANWKKDGFSIREAAAAVAEHPVRRDRPRLGERRIDRRIETPPRGDSGNAVECLPRNNDARIRNSKSEHDDDDVRFGGERLERCGEGSRHAKRPFRTLPADTRRSAEAADEKGDTVRDLLLLVKSQNQQIMSLQTRVDRLLRMHEHSRGGYPEDETPLPTGWNRSSTSAARCRETETSPFPSDQQSGIRAQRPSPPSMNAVMEKKVSIGVMTSFEFSVQNNPFVSDTDYRSNDARASCRKKNGGESVETRLPNAQRSRKFSAPGPLENITEDTADSGQRRCSASTKRDRDEARDSDSPGSPSLLVDRDAAPRTGPPTTRGYPPISEVSEPRSDSTNSSVVFSPEWKRSPVMRDDSRACHPRGDPRPDSSIEKSNDGRDARRAGRQTIRIARERKTNLRDEKSASRRGDAYSGNAEETARWCPAGSSNEPRSRLAENSTAAEDSLVLRRSDFEIVDESPPSLEPSIHVEMREYSSEDENEVSRHTPGVGWTFYKNVVGQVEEILQAVPRYRETDENKRNGPFRFGGGGVVTQDIDHEELVLDSVKAATLDRLKMLGYAENTERSADHAQKKVTFDSTYRSPQPMDFQANASQPANSIAETSTSMHMRALAFKYLSDEQLADFAIQKQGHATSVTHKFLSLHHGSNVSLATMNYLRRYCLLSERHSPECIDGTRHEKKLDRSIAPTELVARSEATDERASENSLNAPGATHDNILDITTLKKQPKLL